MFFLYRQVVEPHIAFELIRSSRFFLSEKTMFFISIAVLTTLKHILIGMILGILIVIYSQCLLHLLLQFLSGGDDIGVCRGFAEDCAFLLWLSVVRENLVTSEKLRNIFSQRRDTEIVLELRHNTSPRGPIL